ncbi:glucose-6-phosphate isomerase [Coriobacteriia bacterium Es71-Z0120]|uniref:glucose-6-phosphate isomerase n=1 Tax=Parvivirga hydrogeniphila TaxID=2939460 RepID=UPI002260C653|nr:glucose-6-phosphate isomerase [Parvivirga hydrogeniphila]MCL4078350.1 glucose-6-phosphate isomerase [Parvivirga hydrogeniphila]
MGSIERLVEANAIERLLARDASLFTDDVDTRIAVGQRLGWLDLASKASARFPLLRNLADAVRDEGATDLLLLGMGGSSLAPLVMSRVIGTAPGYPRLHVLDTTSPIALSKLLQTLDPAGVFVIIASKSGTTVEPLSLYAIVRAWLDDALGRPAAGRRCIVITDPGSPLEKLRQKEVMRLTLSAPPTVGGRYSALSLFGLAPAALTGIDVEALVARAAVMESACKNRPDENPAARLAAGIADGNAQGRDKLTLLTSPALRPFGLWVEQLIAESLGKEGRGVVPVIETALRDPVSYGPDRVLTVVRLAADGSLADWAERARASHDVIELVLEDGLDLGAEFVRWEFATALAGFLIGVNPFDEPNVAEAKAATNDILSGQASAPRACCDLDGTWVTFAGALAPPEAALPSRPDVVRHWLAASRPGDYLAILAYVPDDPAYLEPLERAASALGDATGLPVCVEIGPRYLHSTGQLHKGGPNSGVFLIVTTRDRTDFIVPGQRFTLAALHRAQAEGDLATLARHGRRVMRLDLPSGASDALASLADDIIAAARA